MDAPVRVAIVRGLLGCAAIFDAASFCFGQSNATPPPAYSFAAQRAGVPSNILFAVTLQESGVTIRGRRLPWPWTLNIAGRAHYYATREQACQALHANLKQVPAFRIDVGLAQINLGYQQRFYRHPCEVLSPHKNLLIAATILREQHRAGEDWLMSAGRYHRPAGGELADRYRRRVGRHLKEMALKGYIHP